MKKISIFFFIWSLYMTTSQAQTLTGVVTDTTGSPIIGATIMWEGNTAIGAFTDTLGTFSIPKIDTVKMRHLIISFIGYNPVIVPIEPKRKHLPIEIENIRDLKTVNIEGRRKLGGVSTMNPLQSEVLDGQSLRLAPCCNLGESFVSAASVDVNYSDALTGSKEIEMLGLRGIYTQILMENRPALSGLATPFGLDFYPGTWLESIQISKGAGTVVNGPHPITGQINFELLKPFKSPPFFLNLFANQLGRYEANVHLNHKWSSKIASSLLVHGDMAQNAKDLNNDGFADMPDKKQLNLYTRTEFRDKNFEGQIGIQALYDNRKGGQIQASPGEPLSKDSLFGIDITNKRIEGVFKLGYIGFTKPYQSIGWQNSFTAHNIDSRFGFLKYQGDEKSYYSNLIYESILFNTFHKIRTGASFEYHSTQESISKGAYYLPQNRNIAVPGAFFEYAWDAFFKGNDTKSSNMTLIAGLRFDYLSNWGLLAVPRLHFKYNINTSTIIRLSAGRGWRSPNILSEVLSSYASNRTIQYTADSTRPEIAWNYGVNFTKRFYIGRWEGNFSFDYYRTDFEHQLIPDLDAAAGVIKINSITRSFANSFMVLYAQEVFKGFDFKLAYKFNDVRALQNGELRQRLLTPQQRALLTLHYTHPSRIWDISMIGQYTGSQRLAAVSGNTTGLPDYRIQAQSPGFFTLNGQFSIKILPGLEVYMGGENLFNYMQAQPVMGYDNIYNTNAQKPLFDASQVYGPVMGITGYAGLRWTLKEGWLLKEGIIQTSAKCSICKTAIEGGVKALPGVKTAELNMETKKLTITYSARLVNMQQIRAKIATIGYDADDVRKDEKAYSELPGCCQ